MTPVTDNTIDYGILAGNLILVSIILLCLASFCGQAYLSRPGIRSQAVVWKKWLIVANRDQV